VQSVGIGSNTASTIISGTSMGSLSIWKPLADFYTASPHVAGLAAYLMSLETLPPPPPMSWARIKPLAASTGAMTKSAGKGSTTLIVYNDDGL
jgi:subtilisin family serine protease